MLDTIAVRRVVHQVGVEQFHVRVGSAHRVDIGRQVLEGDLFAADDVTLLGAHRPYRQAGHGSQQKKSPYFHLFTLIIDNKGKQKLQSHKKNQNLPKSLLIIFFLWIQQ